MDIFGKNKIKELQLQLQEANKALNDCHEKLIEKQEVINKTNAYWKGKYHKLKEEKKA